MPISSNHVSEFNSLLIINVRTILICDKVDLIHKDLVNKDLIHKSKITMFTLMHWNTLIKFSSQENLRGIIQHLKKQKAMHEN